MATQTLPTTGPAVRAAMSLKRVSQRSVAEKLNLSQAAVFRRLTGLVDFSVSELTAVAELLETTITDLLSTPSSDAPPAPGEGAFFGGDAA